MIQDSCQERLGTGYERLLRNGEKTGAASCHARMRYTTWKMKNFR